MAGNRPRCRSSRCGNAASQKAAGTTTQSADIDGVGHRVAHGGEFLKTSTLVTDETLAQIERLAETGSASQPGKRVGIHVFRQLPPDAPSVAVFGYGISPDAG